MVSPGGCIGIFHSLLYHGPVALVTDDERVKIQLITILDSRVIHFGNQFGSPHQLLAI